jgi:hypothetical protein
MGYGNAPAANIPLADFVLRRSHVRKLRSPTTYSAPAVSPTPTAMSAAPAISPTSSPRNLRYINKFGRDALRERGDRCSLGSSRHGR